jgi:signal transduction histidine kinase/ActR/RegA family two-component response regulator
MKSGNGDWRLMETICTPFTDGASERLVVMNSRDVTDRAEAERALRDSEEQLRQSQKMEAIGRLAGGVAHDFNNLLTAILGYAQMLEEELLSEGRSAEEAQEIRKAATRATSLTRQLLAFSRKQVMQTRVVNLGSIVSDMDKMLRRLIGEDVELVAETEGDLYSVKVDPGQMEQVVLNLAVNARDAMPSGGCITLRTRNLVVDASRAETTAHLKPGAYVLVEVTDTGVGMDAETQAHMFEPFFTTKGKGKGTGLGLSTVYGIVNQSGGEIWVDSAPGAGTTFRVALPALVDERTIQADHRPEKPEVLDGRETVLLVEDEAWVRGLVRKSLHRYGYTVLVAEDGQHAFELANGFKGPIDLMLTDVVMPRMNGVELAEQLRPLRPDMQVLYMSGYTDHASLSSGAIDLERAFLQKPFTLEAVARKVRETLDEAEASTAAHAQVS